MSAWFGSWNELVDLPLWALAALFTFRIASSFRGGAFGRAARFIAWALTVVAGAKLARALLLYWRPDGVVGDEVGQLVWGITLAAAWSLAGLGIYEFYRAGRSI
jgi:hypothetical protein